MATRKQCLGTQANQVPSGFRSEEKYPETHNAVRLLELLSDIERIQGYPRLAERKSDVRRPSTVQKKRRRTMLRTHLQVVAGPRRGMALEAGQLGVDTVLHHHLKLLGGGQVEGRRIDVRPSLVSAMETAAGAHSMLQFLLDVRSDEDAGRPWVGKESGV